MFRESNKMAVEYAKGAIQFAFLLNGAAATALFAKTQVAFVAPAATFAFGAVAAVLCMGASYVVQLLMLETWRHPGPLYPFEIGAKTYKITLGQMEICRLVAISFWVISIIFFFAGAWKAICVANKLAMTI